MDISQLELRSKLKDQSKPPESVLEESNEDSSGTEPIALLQPVASMDASWKAMKTVANRGSTKESASEETSDNYYYQTQSTTIFHHKIQLVDLELSEIKEQTVISNADSMNIDTIQPLHTILLHTRTMGNLQLVVRTVSSNENKIIDQKTTAYVTPNPSDEPKITRLMSKNELKQFKHKWTKLWRPKFSDQELEQHALLENKVKLPIQEPKPLQIKEPLKFTHSKTYDQIVNVEPLEAQYQTKVPNDSKEAKDSLKYSSESGSKLPMKRSKGVNQVTSSKIGAVSPNTGWETYVDPETM